MQARITKYLNMAQNTEEEEDYFQETEIGSIPDDWKTPRLGDEKYYEILKSGIEKFNGRKAYLSTSSIEGLRIVKIEKEITYNNRPSRANMQPVLNSVWFARMINTLKVYSFTEKNKEEVSQYILSTGFCGIKVNEKTNPNFLKYYFVSDIFNALKNSRCSGAVQVAINNENVRQIPVILPPLQEQQKIAKVLDTIQRAMEEQDKIIKVSKNLKKSLMQKLFTEGLGHTEFKETEIGKIPASWEVVRLGDVASISTGTTPSTKNKEYYTGEIPFIKTNEISNNIINNAQVFITKKAVEDYNLKIYPPNTVFLAMYGQGKTRGQTALLNISATTSQNTAAIIPRGSLDPLYLWCYLQNQYERLRKTGIHGHISHLNLGFVKSYLVPLPPLTEQQEIASILSILHKKIEVEEKKKTTLRELFKTMLHKLMTGEIRLKDVEV